MLKGLWRIQDNHEEAQDFIYKKTWFSQNDDEMNHTQLLQELFWDHDKENEIIDAEIGAKHKNIIDMKDQSLMLSKLF